MSEENTKDLKKAVLKILSRSKLDENGCLVWTGCKIGSGYGMMRFRGSYNLVHRIMHLAFIGDPGDLYVCHACDNPSCVNPRHLWLGTQSDNMRDMMDKGRRRDNPARGQDHWRSELKAEDVLNIRRRYHPMSKTHGGAALAREFKVSTMTISNIVNFQTWKHL